MAIPIDDQGTMFDPKTGKYTGANAEFYTKQSKLLPAPIFSTGNAQSDGKNKLRRIEFRFKGKVYRFILNPEEYSQIEPNRINVTQTKAGAFIDDFGGGVPTINFKGTTGFKTGGSDPTKGFRKFKELRDLIRTYYFKQYPGTNITSANEMTFHNYTDGEHWVVVPKQFSLMRSVARPLLYLYDVQLVCVRPANVPKESSTNFAVSAPKTVVKGK